MLTGNDVLAVMRGYAETTGCRRRYLLGYFEDSGQLTPVSEPSGR